MKLFLVIYAAGKLAGFYGPQIDGLEGCQSQASSFNSAVVVAASMKVGTDGVPLSDEQVAKLLTARAVCEYRRAMPLIGEQELKIRKE